MELERLTQHSSQRLDLLASPQVLTHCEYLIQRHEEVGQEIEFEVPCRQHPDQILDCRQDLGRGQLLTSLRQSQEVVLQCLERPHDPVVVCLVSLATPRLDEVLCDLGQDQPLTLALCLLVEHGLNVVFLLLNRYKVVMQ